MNDIATQPERNPILFGDEGLRAGWSLLLFIALLAAFSFATHFIVHAIHLGPGARTSVAHEQPFRFLAFNETLSFLNVVLASWVMSRIERRPVGAYGLGGDRKLSRFLDGIGWGIGFLSLLVLILKLTGLLVFDARLLHGTDILRYSILWLIGFLLVGLLEEYLLRGYLQFTLARGLTGIFDALNTSRSRTFGFWTAALLLSTIFGLGHRSNAGESPIGLLAAAIAGLVFCLSLWRTGSLWWAIGFHTAWDWAQSFLYGVADSGTMVQFHLFATHPVGEPLISGGATGPEGSLFILPIMALIATVILFTLPKPNPQPSELSRPSSRTAS